MSRRECVAQVNSIINIRITIQKNNNTFIQLPRLLLQIELRMAQSAVLVSVEEKDGSVRDRGQRWAVAHGHMCEEKNVKKLNNLTQNTHTRLQDHIPENTTGTVAKESECWAGPAAPLPQQVNRPLDGNKPVRRALPCCEGVLGETLMVIDYNTKLNAFCVMIIAISRSPFHSTQTL